MNTKLNYSEALIPTVFRNFSYDFLQLRTQSLHNQNLLEMIIKLFKTDELYKLEREEEAELIKIQEAEERERLLYEYEEHKLAFEETYGTPFENSFEVFYASQYVKPKRVLNHQLIENTTPTSEYLTYERNKQLPKSLCMMKR
jgi:hypothetical protein